MKAVNEPTIYLDYASTTPVDPRVASKMMEYLTPKGEFGNPASRSHRYDGLQMKPWRKRDLMLQILLIVIQER
jgi:cysteine sulfinate desulfinase/cysteine desulfurase-like protein